MRPLIPITITITGSIRPDYYYYYYSGILRSLLLLLLLSLHKCVITITITISNSLTTLILTSDYCALAHPMSRGPGAPKEEIIAAGEQALVWL